MPRTIILVLLTLVLLSSGRAQSIDEIKAYVRREEGFGLTSYPDRAGWAIGVGHSESRPRAAITPHEAEALFNHDVKVALGAALRLTPRFESLPQPIRLMIISLVFSVGATGYSRFTSFRAAISRHDYPSAARHLSQSRWARQLPERASHYIMTLNSLPHPSA